MHNLKESRDIENDADIVLLINKPKSDGRTFSVDAAVTIGKQRGGADGFDIPMEWIPNCQIFRSKDR